MMNKRNATIDVARGIAVLSMPAIHTVLIYSRTDVQQGWLGGTLGFFTEWADAPVFMLLMGVSITIARRKTAGQIIFRSAWLLALGYLLNFLKFILPILSGTMPAAFMQQNGIPANPTGTMQLMLMGDILQLSAIANLVCGLIYRLPNYKIIATGTAISVLLATPAIWSLHCAAGFGKLILGIFNGAPPRVFFPVFPWILYPLTGLALGGTVKIKKESGFYLLLSFFGCCLMFAGWAVSRSEPEGREADFYRLGAGGTMCHLGAIFVWLGICHAAVRLCKCKKVPAFITWSSKNITGLYIVQWTVVFWLMPVFGYVQAGQIKSCVAILLTTALTISIVFAWQKLCPRFADREKNTSVNIL